MKNFKLIPIILLISLSGCGYIHHVYYNNKMKSEERQVVDFVKNNKDVIQEVGSIKDVIPSMSLKKHGETLPSRYVVSVYGNKSISVVVNVSRSSFNIQFTVACLGQFPPMKDAFKDRYECKQ